MHKAMETADKQMILELAGWSIECLVAIFGESNWMITNNVKFDGRYWEIGENLDVLVDDAWRRYNEVS